MSMRHYDLTSALTMVLLGMKQATGRSPFDIKALKRRKAELEICKEYGITNITDDDDAESEYMQAILAIEDEPDAAEIGRKYHEEQENKLGQLIVGGTSDSVNNNGWDYKGMFEKPMYDSFENQWRWQPLTIEWQEPKYIIGVDDWYKFKGVPKVKLFVEETEFEKTFNSFMRTKAKEYVERNIG